MDQYWSRPVRNQAAQQEVNLNVMCLNHPETILPPPVRGKIIFLKTGPWHQKGGGLPPQKMPVKSPHCSQSCEQSPCGCTCLDAMHRQDPGCLDFQLCLLFPVFLHENVSRSCSLRTDHSSLTATYLRWAGDFSRPSPHLPWLPNGKRAWLGKEKWENNRLDASNTH